MAVTGPASGGVSYYRDERNSEWWVYLAADCSDLAYEAMLDVIGVRSSVLVEQGVSEGGEDYLVFADA